jgi:lipoprotein NlpD
VRLNRIVVPVLACAFLAACASDYRAPVVERAVVRPVPPKPAVPAVEQKPESYTVKRGDTLYSIARDNGVDYKELAAWNGISDPSVLNPGTVLRLRPPVATTAGQQPEVRTQAQSEAAGIQVQPILAPGAVEAHSLGGDQRPGAESPRTVVEPKVPVVTEAPRPELLKTTPKATKLPYSEENLALMLRMSPPDAKPEGEAIPGVAAQSDSVDWMWPAKGRVLAGSPKGTNKGVDILGRIGDPVFASASGRVVYSGTGLRGYGKLIIIKHNETYLSTYAHNSNLLVKQGDSVVKGQKIAEIGNTDSPQAKLTFEIRRMGKPVDPLELLPDRHS